MGKFKKELTQEKNRKEIFLIVVLMSKNMVIIKHLIECEIVLGNSRGKSFLFVLSSFAFVFFIQVKFSNFLFSSIKQ